MKHKYKIGAKVNHPDWPKGGYILIKKIASNSYPGTYYPAFGGGTYSSFVYRDRDGYILL